MARPFHVTTIGDVGDCGCSAQRPIGSFDDLALLYPPLWPGWIVAKVSGALEKKAGGKDPTEEPSSINELARALGIDPIALVLQVNGHTGIGRIWPAVQLAGGAVALGGLAYVISKRLRRTKGKKRR